MLKTSNICGRVTYGMKYNIEREKCLCHRLSYVYIRNYTCTISNHITCIINRSIDYNRCSALKQHSTYSLSLEKNSIVNMNHDSTVLIEPVRSEEEQPLLPTIQPLGTTWREKLGRAQFIPRKLHIPSKSAVLLLFWSVVVGAIYMTAKGGVNYSTAQLGKNKIDFFRSYDILIARTVFVLVFMLYPIAGFLADTRFGRYKVILTSLCLLAVGMAFLSVDSILYYTKYAVRLFNKSRQHGVALFFIIAISGLVAIILGFAGYEANFIQFGIDQLADAPSEYLGLFVHWVEWFTMIGTAFAHIIFSLLRHCLDNHTIDNIVASVPILYLILLIAMVTFTCWKRHWFNIEPARSNPYKMVIKVLNFVRKHGSPAQRSAFTYCDDELPSRLDFAKERYGGPFTSEQVEDVRTFLRILVILLAQGPIFALEVPVGPLLPIFFRHVIKPPARNETACSAKEVMFDSESLKSIATVILFPLYVWLIYSVLRRCIPKTFTRIRAGIIVLVSGLVCMFFLDLLAHILYHKHHKYGVKCMFKELRRKHYNRHLDLPWPVNLAPGFLTQAGITVIITTTFEFISAQSPYSMKGLLIGVMFAVRGIFQLLFSTAILVFSLKKIWGTQRMKHHTPPIFNCGFGYLLFTCIVGLTGLILFSLAVKRYRYRERNYGQYRRRSDEEIVHSS